MNRRILAGALAAAVVTGVAITVLPQHATSIVRVGAATVAAVAAALVLGAVAPIVAREPTSSALDQLPMPGAPPLDPHGLRDARRDLDRPTAAGTLPAAVRRRLVGALQVRGVTASQLPPQLTDVPTAGSDRDPEGVARLVIRILDATDQGTTHGHH